MTPASRGFSLIEVLVAFVILALALGVLMRIFAGGLNNIGTAEGYTRALAIAESRLAAAGIEAPLTEGENQGEDEQGFSWRTRVQRADDVPPPTEGISPAVDLFRVDVTVQWDQDRPKPRALTLTSLRLAARE